MNTRTPASATFLFRTFWAPLGCLRGDSNVQLDASNPCHVSHLRNAGPRFITSGAETYTNWRGDALPFTAITEA